MQEGRGWKLRGLDDVIRIKNLFQTPSKLLCFDEQLQTKVKIYTTGPTDK